MYYLNGTKVVNNEFYECNINEVVLLKGPIGFGLLHVLNTRSYIVSFSQISLECQKPNVFSFCDYMANVKITFIVHDFFNKFVSVLWINNACVGELLFCLLVHLHCLFAASVFLFLFTFIFI